MNTIQSRIHYILTLARLRFLTKPQAMWREFSVTSSLFQVTLACYPNDPYTVPWLPTTVTNLMKLKSVPKAFSTHLPFWRRISRNRRAQERLLLEHLLNTAKSSLKTEQETSGGVPRVATNLSIKQANTDVSVTAGNLLRRYLYWFRRMDVLPLTPSAQSRSLVRCYQRQQLLLEFHSTVKLSITTDMDGERASGMQAEWEKGMALLVVSLGGGRCFKGRSGKGADNAGNNGIP